MFLKKEIGVFSAVPTMDSKVHKYSNSRMFEGGQVLRMVWNNWTKPKQMPKPDEELITCHSLGFWVTNLLNLSPKCDSLDLLTSQ